jgi:hypothetical protein
VAGFVQMMLQLLLRFPSALPDGPDLLRGRHRTMRTLVKAIPYTFASIPHKGIVSPDLPTRKTKPGTGWSGRWRTSHSPA